MDNVKSIRLPFESHYTEQNLKTGISQKGIHSSIKTNPNLLVSRVFTLLATEG